MTIEEVRKAIEALPAEDRCHDTCPGWIIANGDEIQVCDDCNQMRRKWMSNPGPLDDDDVAQLPEAQEALAKSLAEGPYDDYDPKETSEG